MARPYKALEADGEALKAALSAAKDLHEYRRLQCVHLRVSVGLDVSAIATATGLSESCVRRLHCLFRQGGIDALLSKERKGKRRHAHMSVEEERAFVAPFIEKAKSGGILTVSCVHRALEEKLGKKIHKSVTYNILHRCGWRKIAPRPKHPKADAAAQEAFKKIGRTS
jgi:transposase